MFTNCSHSYFAAVLVAALFTFPSIANTIDPTGLLSSLWLFFFNPMNYYNYYH